MLSRVSRRYAGTAEYSGTLAAYLREIAKLPRLTVDEERDLGTRIQRDRDDAALGRLVESNLRFVVSYAKRYRGLGVSLLDLIHEGNLGLIEAARRFDPQRNVKFIACAVWWVRQAMIHGLSDQTRASSFPPTLLPRFVDLLSKDLVPPVEDEMVHQSDLDELAAALGDFERKEREVFRLRFGLGDDEPGTRQEIGDRMRLSRQVRQIESRAKDKLRQSARLRSHLN
jgi:RNA polymerase primary sigma factor